MLVLLEPLGLAGLMDAAMEAVLVVAQYPVVTPLVTLPQAVLQAVEAVEAGGLLVVMAVTAQTVQMVLSESLVGR